MTLFAASLTCVLLGALAIFQAALIAGAPLGHYAWGGQHRVLPRNLRIGSLIAIVLYGLFATIVLGRIGVVPWLPVQVVDIGVWVVAAYLAVGIPLNAISRSKPERLTMTPLIAILFLLVLTVAMSS